MKDLLFICQWGKSKELAWSGTYYKLFKELSKHYNTIDYPLNNTLHKKITNYMLRKHIPLVKYDFQYSTIKHSSQKIKKEFNQKKICAFLFSDMNISDSIHSYIYQDMCIEFLYNMYYENPTLWDKSTYSKISIKSFENRLINQKDFYKSCSGIFTMGKWLADYLVNTLKIDKEKVHYVGGGIDINTNLIRKVKKNRDKILFVGRDFYRKGGPLLLRAFKILRDTMNPNVQLYIIGPENNPVDNNLYNGVNYIGPLNSNLLVDYYNKCDIFCMPSYIEAYGKVFIEALCCGLPCIGRASFEMKELIQDGVNGYLINNDDDHYLAQTIYKLLNNDKIIDYVYRKQKDYQAEYSWASVVQKIANIIDMDSYMISNT